jgi:RNA 3'-terminal phosphate cyclase
VASACNARTQGISQGSSSILFCPQSSPQVGHYDADVATAGATTLLYQVALPCLLFATSEKDEETGQPEDQDGRPASGSGQKTSWGSEGPSLKRRRTQSAIALDLDADGELVSRTCMDMNVEANTPADSGTIEYKYGAKGLDEDLTTDSTTGTYLGAGASDIKKAPFKQAASSTSNRALEQEIPAPTHSVLTLHGGTNASYAPHADYTQRVLLPLLRAHILPLPRASASHPAPLSSEDGPKPDVYTSEDISLDIVKRGFYPKGGGILRARIPALPKGDYLRPIDLVAPEAHRRGAGSDELEQTRVKIEGTTFVRGLPARIGNEMREGAMGVLRSRLPHFWEGDVNMAKEMDTDAQMQVNVEIKGEVNPKTGPGAGSGIFLLASISPSGFTSASAPNATRTSTSTNPSQTQATHARPFPLLFGASSSGTKGIPARRTGSLAAQELLPFLPLPYHTSSNSSPSLNPNTQPSRRLPSTVDTHMQDQLIIFMALANGWSAIRVGGEEGLTLHTRTAMWVAECLVGCLFEVEESSEGGKEEGIVLKCFSVGVEGRDGKGGDVYKEVG